MRKHGQSPNAPFVNRESELDVLHKQWDLCIHSGEPRFILIQGEFGTGKTALVKHFVSQLREKNPQTLICEGRCSLEDAGSGLTPFLQVLANVSAMCIQNGSVPKDLAKFLGKIAPAWLSVIPVVGSLLSALLTTHQAKSSLKAPIQINFSRDNVFFQFTNVITKMLEKNPAIWFIDDLQWADESSLRLLFHLKQNLNNMPLMIICAYRPIETMEPGQKQFLFREIRAHLIGADAKEIELKQGIDVTRYVKEKYQNHSFSKSFLASIQKISNGHPLFVSLLFAMWEEKGLILERTMKNGKKRWIMKPGVEVEIPEQIGVILEVRFGLLDRDLLDVLRFASVVGEYFSAQIIQNLSNVDICNVYNSLGALVKSYKLIYESGTKTFGNFTTDFYKFSHRFICEYVYSTISSGQRRHFHRRVGECMENMYPDSGPNAGQLAHHFRAALEPLKALRYTTMAANYEQSRNAWAESNAWTESGLKLIESLPESDEVNSLKFKLMEQSAWNEYNIGNMEKANREYETTINFGLAKGIRKEIVAKACSNNADICEERGLYENGIFYIDIGKKCLIGSQIDVRETSLDLETKEALIILRKDSPEKTIPTFMRIIDEGYSLPPTTSLERILAYSYNALGIALGYSNRLEESTINFQKALTLSEKIGDNYLARTIMINLANNMSISGCLVQAKALASKAIATAQKIGDLGNRSYGLGVLGDILFLLGKYKTAINKLKESIALMNKIGSDWYLPFVHADLAKSYLAIFKIEKAQEHARRGMQLASELEDNHPLAYAQDAAAQVESALGNWEAANELFSKAMTLRQQSGDKLRLAPVLLNFGLSLWKQGKHELSVQNIIEAMNIFHELKLAHEVENAKRMAEKAGVDLGQWPVPEPAA